MRVAAIVTIAALGVSTAHAQPTDGAHANPPPADMPINAPAEPGTQPPSPAPPPPSPADTAPPAAPAPAAEPAPADVAPATSEAPIVVAPPAPAPSSSNNKDAAWLFVGGALTFVTAGAVLAYSTSSAEQDLRDLYMTASGDPATFDLETQERYDELTAEGRRYEILSWASFGVAAACAAGAAIFFVRASHESDVVVAPAVTGSSAAVTLRLGF